MSKGLLMVAVLEVQSDYYKDRDYRIAIKSDQATFTHFDSSGHQAKSFGKNYQLFPLTNNLEVTLYEN